jgi:hypothetical protein
MEPVYIIDNAVSYSKTVEVQLNTLNGSVGNHLILLIEVIVEC